MRPNIGRLNSGDEMTIRVRLGIGILCIMSIVDVSAFGQTSDTTVKGQLTTLEGTVRALANQVSELDALLRAALPPSPIEDLTPFILTLEHDDFKGSAEAKVAIIEFSDFQCPFCGKYAQGAYRDLQREYVDTGKVRYIVRNMPIEKLHPLAMKAAEAGQCAREQGKYWEMHDRLFASQEALKPSDLLSHARALDLDQVKFQSCLDGGTMAARIAEDVAEARRLGLTGTPAFLIGEIDSHSNVRVTQRITGAQPFQVFHTALERLLIKPTRRATH
jgi:protein-disulfide isomerase